MNDFFALNRNPGREVYSHFMNATDTDLNVTRASVEDIIIQDYGHRLN